MSNQTQTSDNVAAGYTEGEDVPPEHIDYARMALLTYSVAINDNDIPEGWVLSVDSTTIDGLKNGFERKGFRGLAFKKDDHVVISVRGTANWQNIKDDKHLFLGRNVEFLKIYDAAKEFIKVVKTEVEFQQITLTGHSLGGAAVEMLAWDKSLSIVTFDSPGFNTKEVNNDHVIHYLSIPNLVNTCYKHIGETRRLKLQLSNNFIDNMRAAFRKFNQETLKFFTENSYGFFQAKSTHLTQLTVTKGIEKIGVINDFSKSHSIKNIVTYLEGDLSPKYSIETTHFSQSQHVAQKINEKATEVTGSNSCSIL